jgi:hypothetical protein
MMGAKKLKDFFLHRKKHPATWQTLGLSLAFVVKRFARFFYGPPGKQSFAWDPKTFRIQAWRI